MNKVNIHNLPTITLIEYYLSLFIYGKWNKLWSENCKNWLVEIGIGVICHYYIIKPYQRCLITVCSIYLLLSCIQPFPHFLACIAKFCQDHKIGQLKPQEVTDMFEMKILSQRKVFKVKKKKRKIIRKAA